MTQDTRKDRRVKIVSLNVRYKSATVDEFIENHAYDVSRGGIFIKTANPFPPGTLLKFEIRLASEQAVIAGVGRIVWKRDAGASSTERPAGMGVKFIKLDEPSKVVIDRLVNTRADAGRAFEAEDPTRQASDRPVPRTTPPGRPVSSPPAARAPAARSMSPAGGIPTTATAPKAPSVAAGASSRKATMIGVGAISPAPPAPTSSPALPGLPSTVPPARPSFPAAPSAPPRPGGAPMFPKSSRESDWPSKQEPTVMKQAAELLEEALREAGGSMEEIGTNPLFSGSEPSASAGADFKKNTALADEAKVGAADPDKAAPFASAREWTTPDPAQPPTETQAAPDAVLPAEAEEKPIAQPSAALRSSRETPTSVRPASGAARASDQAPTNKKGGSGGLVLFWLAAAAVIIGVVMFRQQLFGAGVPPEPVAAPPPETARLPSTVASIPGLQSASPTATAASASAGATSATGAAASATAPATSVPSSPSAMADHVPPGQKSADMATPAAPLRPQKPSAKPMAPPAAPTTPADTSVQAAPPTEASPGPPASTATAASAATAQPTKAPPPAPKPKAGKGATDDNPY